MQHTARLRRHRSVLLLVVAGALAVLAPDPAGAVVATPTQQVVVEPGADAPAPEAADALAPESADPQAGVNRPAYDAAPADAAGPTAGSTTEGVGTEGAATEATARVFGAEPLADVLYWADQKKACGLTRDQLAAMMLAPIFPETGAGSSTAPSPMTLSRWDTQSTLYAFSDNNTGYQRAFWHPGVGMWQFDSAGGWDLTAADAINSATSAQQAATVMASRWCKTPTRSYAWGPWYGCTSTSVCEDIYNSIFDGTSLVNVATDPSVTRGGGTETRTCEISGIGAVVCTYVDPARAQGAKGWASPGAGPTPITAPFYVFRSGGYEYRYWLKQDTGYDQTVAAFKPVTANARTSLAWSTRSDFCDITALRGECVHGAFGNLERWSTGPSSVWVTGWAGDPDTTGPLDIHVHVDGVNAAVLRTGLARPDVAASFPYLGGTTGFAGSVPASAGTHWVCAYALNVGNGGNGSLGCATVTVAGGPPVGNLDAAYAGAGTVFAQGWALDPDTAAPIAVHVYVDGVGVAGTAAATRPDVAAAYPAYGAEHGFRIAVPASPGDHTVCAYGIDAGGGTNAGLGCRAVSVPTGSPWGALDVATPGFTTLAVAGWALDPDTLEPIDVHVYVDGALRGVGRADAARPDLGAAFPAFGPSHGYQVTATPVGGGPHQVCVYGINVGAGGNVPVGCRTVTGIGDPGGNLDVVAPSPARVAVAGWALDPDTAAPVAVHVYVDGVLRAGVTADRARADIGALFPAYTAAHGFEVTVDAIGGGPHTVCAYAINAAFGSTNTTLGCVPFTGSGEPVGNLDVAAAGTGAITLRGWALDPDTNGATEIHVYVDGVGTAILSTASSRPDIYALFPSYGPNRGFDALIGTGLPAGRTVCAYAINTGSGGTNPLLGCRTT